MNVAIFYFDGMCVCVWGGGGGGFQERSLPPYCFTPYVFVFYCPFQSEEDIDKKESGIFICHFPRKISQFGVFRVSDSHIIICFCSLWCLVVVLVV